MMREQPLLLVLDEPTSALDAQAEHLLFEQYAGNARRVGRADSRITEAGNHAALIAQQGLYAELHALQAAAYR